MLAALAAYTREGGVMRACVDDNSQALRRSSHPKIGVVYTPALEQRSLLPANSTDVKLRGVEWKEG